MYSQVLVRGLDMPTVHGSVPMFPGSYVPQVPCSPGPMFPGPMFPGSYVGGGGGGG